MAGLPGPPALAGAMRSVSYVQRVALDFSGSLFPHAICLGDVDNDTVSACALRETPPGPAALRLGGSASGGGAGDVGKPPAACVRRERCACAVRLRGGRGEAVRAPSVPRGRARTAPARLSGVLLGAQMTDPLPKSVNFSQ